MEGGWRDDGEIAREVGKEGKSLQGWSGPRKNGFWDKVGRVLTLLVLMKRSREALREGLRMYNKLEGVCGWKGFEARCGSEATGALP